MGGGEHHDARAGLSLDDGPRQLHPSGVTQPEVSQHDLDGVIERRKRLVGGSDRRDHLDVRLVGEHPGEALHEHRMIIDDEHADHIGERHRHR